MLTENEKQGLIHRLLSEYTYYRIDLADGWGHISHSFAANIRKIGTRKPSVFEFYVKTPSPQVAYGADILYERTMRHLRFKDFLHQDNVLNVLRKHIIDCEESRKALVDDDLDPVYYWTDEMDEKIEILGKNIEDIKIKLYKNADATKQRIERIRKDLKISQDKYNYLYERKHLFNDRTAEFIASKIYFRYMKRYMIPIIKELRGYRILC